MLSKKLLEAINHHINYELYSEYIYLAMAAYCDAQDLSGCANFFKVQVEEERFHAMKFYDYVVQMDGRVTLGHIAEPRNEYGSILEVFKEALKHEQLVTRRIYDLADIASDEREHATMSFLKWFIDEQVEEENTISTIVKRLERIGEDSTALYMLDAELAQRVFTPPVNA